jgi:hypothetical protein
MASLWPMGRSDSSAKGANKNADSAPLAKVDAGFCVKKAGHI